MRIRRRGHGATVHVHYLAGRTLDLIHSLELPARDVHNCPCVQLVAGSSIRTLDLTVRTEKRHTYPNDPHYPNHCKPFFDHSGP